MVSRLRHENLVELLGYCVDGNLRVLAYEFATMGSLHDILHGMRDQFVLLDEFKFISLKVSLHKV